MSRRLDPRLAAVIAVVLLGGVLLGILTLGRLHYPQFPSLREQPDRSIPGLIAYVRWDEDSRDGRSCLWVVAASGEHAPRRLVCDREVGGPVRWTPRGIELHTPEGTRVIDPVTGRTRERTQGTGVQAPPFPGTPESRTLAGITLVPRSGEPGRAELWLEHGDGVQSRVAFADGPRDYTWWDAVWAPGGRYAAVQDSAQRLLIVDTERGLVRLLAEDAGQAVWGEWNAAGGDGR